MLLKPKETLPLDGVSNVQWIYEKNKVRFGTGLFNGKSRFTDTCLILHLECGWKSAVQTAAAAAGVHGYNVIREDDYIAC